MEIMLVSMHALTLQQLSELPLTLRMSTIKAAAKSIPPTTVSPTRPEQDTRSRNQTSLAVGSYFNTYNSFLCRLWPSTKTYVALSIGKACCWPWTRETRTQFRSDDYVLYLYCGRAGHLNMYIVNAGLPEVEYISSHSVNQESNCTII